MNLPSPETKKPWPFALKCPVSSKTETIMTAGRIGCATSAKLLVGVCEGCADDVAVDWTGAGDAGGGEGSGTRAVELLRPHETKAHRVRMKQSGTRHMRLNDTRARRRLKENQRPLVVALLCARRAELLRRLNRRARRARPSI